MVESRYMKAITTGLPHKEKQDRIANKNYYLR